jgi:hypothetical protein
MIALMADTNLNKAPQGFLWLSAAGKTAITFSVSPQNYNTF